MVLRHNGKNALAMFLSWGLVLLWMGILFWFSSQPAIESAQLSIGVMEVGRRFVSHWEGIGILSFIIIYHIVLVWVVRMKSHYIIKILLFLLFLVMSLSAVYVILRVILPRVDSFGIFQMNRWVIHRYLRKYAHFFIYLFLGGVVKNALNVSGLKGWKSIGLAILLCFSYAVFDEIHQYFVPGRMPLVMDVIIDTAGATVGIILYSSVNGLFQLIKTKQRTVSLF